MIKTLNLTVYGIVIIPITYLLSFLFKDQETAFKNSGLILYFFGFLIADTFSSVLEDDFYLVHSDQLWKLAIMLNPFMFNYWTLGYPSKDKHPQEQDFNFNCQIIFCGVQFVIAMFLLWFVMLLDRIRFRRVQGFDKNHKEFDAIKEVSDLE